MSDIIRNVIIAYILIAVVCFLALIAIATHYEPHKEKQYLCDLWREDKRVSTVIVNAREVALLLNTYTMECTGPDGSKGWIDAG